MKFDDDLVLDEGDYDDGKVGTPAAVAVAAEQSGKAVQQNSEINKKLVEHGRVTEYVVAKCMGKLPTAQKLGDMAADVINDNWGDSDGLIKLVSAQTQFIERGKDPAPRGLARFIRKQIDNYWEVAKWAEVDEGVVRL